MQLSWQSGTYTGADLAGFRIYSSDSPGGAIDYTTPLATITAYPVGDRTDGFGFGGFGGGGFGQAPGTYTWTSDPLAAGTWSFAIVSFDAAGNAGPAQTTTATITAPPREPAFFADGIDAAHLHPERRRADRLRIRRLRTSDGNPHLEP